MPLETQPFAPGQLILATKKTVMYPRDFPAGKTLRPADYIRIEVDTPALLVQLDYGKEIIILELLVGEVLGFQIYQPEQVSKFWKRIM